MSFAKVSRPASGVEHYISHIWDMRSLEFGTKHELHGIQCAMATAVVAGLYERLITVYPDKERALAFVNSFSYDEWAKTLKAFVGKVADAMIVSHRQAILNRNERDCLGQNAAEKPHKMSGSVDFSTDPLILILISKTIFFSIIMYLHLKVAFFLR